MFIHADIVDIKPTNMEELTEVITAAEFHPTQCNVFMYSSSKSNIKLADMRDSALCDRHAKCTSPSQGYIGFCSPSDLLRFGRSVRGGRGSSKSIIFLGNYFLHL